MKNFRIYGLFILLAIWLSVCLIGRVALAETFCVSDETEFQEALDTAAINDEDDVVKLLQRTYYGNFEYISSEAFALTILGGYNHPRCKKRGNDRTTTVLDGSNSGTVLVLNAPDVAVDFVVDGVTLQNGYGPATNGTGGLYAGTNNSGTLTLSNSIIRKIFN